MKFLLLTLFLTASLHAEDNLKIVAIGQAEQEVEEIFFSVKGLRSLKSNKKKAQIAVEVFQNDFSYYRKLFKVQGRKSPVQKGHHVNFQFFDEGGLRLSVTLSNRNGSKAKFDAFLSVGNLRQKIHQINDNIYRQLTGKSSIFNSKIIFVSDKGSRRSHFVKELYSMDYDGGNKKQLTFHKGTVIGPALSYDKKKVLYSLIRSSMHKRNVNLYMLDLETGKHQVISSRRGLNTGAVFFPGDKEIILTMSHEGNAELYKMELETKKLTRLTKHFAPDVDPSINVQGNVITFLSGRPGKPMIYIMDPSGIERSVKRIGYVGQFNATPRFSPDGREIAFSSWMDNRFDIFRIDANGMNLVRLTKDYGSNEDPTYSNDGQFVAFSSQRVISRRKAVNKVVIMDRDGEIFGPITEGFGNCITPRWSK